MERVEPRELSKGDTFSEDRDPNKYEVVGFTTISGRAAVIGENVETGETSEFGGPLAFRQPLFRYNE